MAGEGAFHPLPGAGDLAPGEARHFDVAGREIGLFNVEGAFYAIDDICTHMRARLSDGYVEGDIVECPLHFGRFNIRTGKACGAPCTQDVRVYAVRHDGMLVEIQVPDG